MLKARAEGELPVRPARSAAAVSRYLIVETDEATTPAEPPPGHRPATGGSLRAG